MAEIKKYVSLDKLTKYDAKIKSLVDQKDATTLQSAKDYADGLAVNYEKAGAAATAEANAKAYADGKDAAIQAAQSTADSAVQAAATADGKAVAAQGTADANAAKIGVVPEGSTVMGIIEEIQENAYDDSELRGLISGLDTNKADKTQVATDIGAAKTELEGKISTAQAAADAAQSHSEGVAGDLADAVEALEGADSAQVERIAALEGTIVGLSGAMHFEGVKEEIPTDVTGYEAGDVIIVGNKEYVFNDGAFVEFGDVSAQAEAITALTGRVETAEGEIDTLQSDLDNAEAAIELRAVKSEVDAAIAGLEGADEDQVERIAALETAVGESGSIAQDIATAKQEAIDAAAADASSKASSAETAAKGHADSLNTAMNSRVEALEAIDHDHANKALIDTYTQTEADLADAVAKKHAHANADVLAGISAEKVAAWDGTLQGAKDYADGLNTAMDAKVTANTEAINSFEEVSEAEINALFQ